MLLPGRFTSNAFPQRNEEKNVYDLPLRAAVSILNFDSIQPTDKVFDAFYANATSTDQRKGINTKRNKRTKVFITGI